MRPAGRYRHRLHVQRRGAGNDGYGQETAGDFATVFTVYAAMVPLRGSEAVMAARLQGRQPFVVTVRQSPDTRQITPAWRLVDARNANRIFAITAPPVDPDGSNGEFDIIVVEGGIS